MRMKKNLVAMALLTLSCLPAFSQIELFQATIKQGANANQFLVYVRPSQNIQDIPGAGIFAGGAPQVVFSVLGNTAVFTPTYHLGASPLSNTVQTAGGRTRMVVGPTNASNITLPWNANEERLAFTVNIAGDDTVGARLEADFVTFGQFVFFVSEQNTGGTDWTNYTDPFYPGGVGSVEGTDGIFSYVTIPSTIVVPVTFSKFNAQCHEKGASITWSTATEQNSKQFDIERSDDGINWRVIGSVPAAGNSNAERNYNYLDLEGGAALYRIRQKDFDGRSIITDIKRTDCKSSDVNVALYPIPTRDNLTVVIRSDKDMRTDLQIVDMKGSVLRRMPTQINKGNNTINLSVSELPAGQYMLRSADAGMFVNKAFTVAR